MPYQPRASLENAYGPQVTFRTLDVLPPAAFYVGLDDQIVLNVYTDYPNSVFTLSVRMLNPQGVVTPETLTLYSGPSGYQTLQGNLTGLEGYLLSACLSAPGMLPGAAYSTVRLMRAPALATGITTATLIAGAVTDKYPLSYPAMAPLPPLTGPGHLIAVTPTAPAGADWAVNVAHKARWRIRSLMMNLATSAAVANRVPHIILKDNQANQIGFYIASTPQTASQTLWYSLNPGGEAGNSTIGTIIPASSELVLEDNAQIFSSTAGIQAADQYASVALQVEEWLAV